MSRPRIPRRRELLLGLTIALTGCLGEPAEESFSLRFVAQVNGQEFSCDRAYQGVGSSGSEMRPKDLRMYVHDVTLVRAGGERVALALTPDGVWQSDTIALLDFERRAGECQNGTDGTNELVIGTAPDHDDYTGVEFTVGVPIDQNHLDIATAEAPLNISGMYWEWERGYRFLRVDVWTPMNPQYNLHVGSTGCSGTPAEGFSCNHDNLITIALEGFDPRADAVALDIGELLAGSDLDFVNDKDVDPVPGCMSGIDDPQCPALYAPLGLSFAGVGPADDPQRVFRVEPGGAEQ